MKVFITGGAGFIGSHLSDCLLKEGHKVLVLDDLTTGQMANIDHLIGHENFDYRIGSTTDSPLVVEITVFQRSQHRSRAPNDSFVSQILTSPNVTRR